MSKAAIAEKEKFVDAFAEELKAAKAILVINYLGLTVEEVTNMRKELRDNDVKMKVIKNTYLRRAAAKAGIEGLDDTFVGPTAVIYTDNADDVTEPARLVSVLQAPVRDFAYAVKAVAESKDEDSAE